jgi:hypothetical protein
MVNMNRLVKILALILSVLCFLFLVSCVIVSDVDAVKTTKENTTAQTTRSTSLESKAIGKFGFLRNAFDMDLEKTEETGASRLRPNFGYFVWGFMQKDENAPIDFSKTDEVVRSAQKHKLHLLVTLFPFADWDQKTNGDKCKVSENDEALPRQKGDFEIPGLPYYRCNPNDWTSYGKWLAAVVERYDGDGKDDMEGLEYPILQYEIGNEPDLTRGPQSDSGTVFYLGTPEDYGQLLQKSYTGIKSSNSNVRVLIAGAAGVQPQFQEFWKRVFSILDIADYFDIANVHCISAPNQNENDPVTASAEDLNVTVYKNLLSEYKINKPIWVTEAENIQGSDTQKNVERLRKSVNDALKNGAEKIFFTGASFSDDPMKYTSDILIKEKDYYKSIILEQK